MTAPLADLPHLVRRFLGHVTARPLSPAEQLQVRSDLADDRLAHLFFLQDPADQRHAVDVAAAFASTRPGDRQGVQAALLHDVGKCHARLGAVARSMATVFGAVGLPMPARWRSYLAHGSLGADDLAAAGAGALAVAFARYHPGDAPAGIPPDVWADLLAADDR